MAHLIAKDPKQTQQLQHLFAEAFTAETNYLTQQASIRRNQPADVRPHGDAS